VITLIFKGKIMWETNFLALKATLSENIKRLRRERGIAQERLGLESDVDRTLVSKIERQIANPSLEILSKIATQLDVSVVTLLTRQK
jgi:transcriptional regulator with XRE-family HTH domain